jgi:hypothetical protein
MVQHRRWLAARYRQLQQKRKVFPQKLPTAQSLTPPSATASMTEAQEVVSVNDVSFPLDAMLLKNEL